LKDISFGVSEGEYFVLVGPSGVGKTLLLETIAGMHIPDSGRIHLDGSDITCERIQRRKLALVYQDRSLFPHMTVGQNVAYGLRSRKRDRVAIAERVRALAGDVGIQPLLDRLPGTLSSGEAQRVALARALATEPRCLLLDEPLSSLDAGSRGRLRSLLRALNRRGHTMLHVTHDYDEAMSLASRVGIMDKGRIAHIGGPREVFRHPRSEFIANFIGMRNFFRGQLRHVNGRGAPAEFVTAGPVFHVLTDEAAGPGHLMLRSEDVAVSSARPADGARNAFEGTVSDMCAARSGVEVVVDVGVEVAALLSAESAKRPQFRCGRKAWVSFKPGAARFLRQ